MPTRAEWVDAARGWMGTRWLHQGRTRMGVDCVGLILMSLSEIGINIPDMQGYRRSPDPAKFLGHIRENSLHVTAPEFGAFGVFRDGTQPCHVGIFAEMHGQLSLLHSYAGTGVVMEELFIHDWPKKLVEVRSIEGLS